MIRRLNRSAIAPTPPTIPPAIDPTGRLAGRGVGVAGGCIVPVEVFEGEDVGLTGAAGAEKEIISSVVRPAAEVTVRVSTITTVLIGSGDEVAAAVTDEDEDAEAIERE